jgi:hypothetical protein
MRADMGKVLVERPRLRGCRYSPDPETGYRKRVEKILAAGDTPPAREGMKRPYGSNRKYFNEHLGPLRRFLESNVGRPWDKVYSEICQFVDRGNVVQKHILTHLFDYVVTNVVLIDGEPCRGKAHCGHSYGQPLRTALRYHLWYVCPKSGLLKRTEYQSHKRKHRPKPRPGPKPPAYIWVGDRAQVRWIDNGWELVGVEPLPATGRGAIRRVDPVLNKPVGDLTAGILRGTYGRVVYAVSRRRLARKELKDYPIPMEWWG